MTCIIGYKYLNRVWIGADGRATFGYEYMSTLTRKVVRVGDLLIGVSGEPRVVQSLYRMQDSGIAVENDYLYVVNFFEDFRLRLKDEGMIGVGQLSEKCGCHFIVGCSGKLFYVDGSFGVYEVIDNFTATGSASQFALGYLAAVEEFIDRPTDVPVSMERALARCADVDLTVGPPYFVEEL